MENRRVNPRFPVGQWGELRPLEWQSMLGQRRVRIVDVSDGGIGLETQEAIPAGTAVRVSLGKSSYLGKVVYSRSLGARFVTGVQMHSDTRSIPRAIREGD